MTCAKGNVGNHGSTCFWLESHVKSSVFFVKRCQSKWPASSARLQQLRTGFLNRKCDIIFKIQNFSGDIVSKMKYLQGIFCLGQTIFQFKFSLCEFATIFFKYVAFLISHSSLTPNYSLFFNAKCFKGNFFGVDHSNVLLWFKIRWISCSSVCRSPNQCYLKWFTNCNHPWSNLSSRLCESKFKKIESIRHKAAILIHVFNCENKGLNLPLWMNTRGLNYLLFRQKIIIFQNWDVLISWNT